LNHACVENILTKKSSCIISNTGDWIVIQFNTVPKEIFRRGILEFFSQAGKQYKIIAPIHQKGIQRMVYRTINPMQSHKKMGGKLRSA